MKQEKKFVVDVLFVLALFGVFTISVLFLVIIGADVYKNTVDKMRDNYDSRTAIAYMTEKIRQSDSLLSDERPAVSIGTLEQQPALVLAEDLDGSRYCTYLYLYNGCLKELRMREDSYLGDHVLSAGQDILALDSLEFNQISDNLLSVSMTLPDGANKQLYLNIRCK